MFFRSPILAILFACTLLANGAWAAEKAPTATLRLLVCQVGQAVNTHTVVGDPDIVTTPNGVFIITGIERLDSGEIAPFKLLQQGGVCNLTKAATPVVTVSAADGRYHVVIDIHHDQDVVWHAESVARLDETLRLKSKTDTRPGEEVPTWIGLELRLSAKGDDAPTVQYTITHYDHGAVATMSNTVKADGNGVITGKTPGYDTATPLDYSLTVTKG